jgi:hypothetical protein
MRRDVSGFVPQSGTRPAPNAFGVHRLGSLCHWDCGYAALRSLRWNGSGQRPAGCRSHVFGRAAVPRRRRSGRVCLKTISRRRGELHESLTHTMPLKMGTRITRRSDTFETVPAAPPHLSRGSVFAVSVALVRQRSHSRAGNSLRKVVQTVFPQKWQTNGNNSQARAWVPN